MAVSVRTLITAAFAAALVVAATAQSPAPAPSRKAPTQIRLLPQNNSGESGTATLYDGVKGLIVKLRMSGSGGDVDQPAHIHKGTCEKLDPKPAYPLKPVHDGLSETTIESVTLAQLQKAPYAINVHKSAKEAAVYVSCGNLVAPK
ncbi:MAG TPA: hypothetical protein VHS78_04955 [Candidatus Elarobacter sp.]|jgi:hypothetical protein|nr:hypothetical protein [Candidatus Elarobacter sp.]